MIAAAMLPVSALCFVLSILPKMTAPAAEAWDAYLAGDFTAVNRIVSDSSRDSTLSAEAQSHLFLVLGCSEAIQGQTTEAVAAFEQALRLNPLLDLTPADVPPLVLSVFRVVKERLHGEQMQPDDMPQAAGSGSLETGSPDTVTVRVPVFRGKSTVLKSLILPGWGHIAENRKRGYVFIGLQAASLIGFALAAGEADRARGEYLSVTDPARIEERYDEYNRFHRLAWGFGIAAIGTYLVAQIDLFGSPPPVSTAHGSRRSDLVTVFAIRW